MKELLEIEMSELASNIVQAASRGRCRTVTQEGKAFPMTIHLITKEKRLRPLLGTAMPGVRWEQVDVRLSTEDAPLTRTRIATLKIMAFLESLPRDQISISLKAIFASSDFGVGNDAKSEAIKMAVVLLGVAAKKKQVQPWTVDKRSLIRGKI